VAEEATQLTVAGRSPWELAWLRLRKDKTAITSAVVIVILVVLAICAPLIAHLVGHGPNTQYPLTGLSPAGLPLGPNTHFLFGTDDLGRDILVRTVYGARVSLLVGIIASVSAMVIGTAIGMVAGFVGGAVDTLLSRFMDVILSFPFLLAAIALVSVVGPSLVVTIAVIAFFSWASVGRIVRGLTLSIREKEYIEAARAVGQSNFRLMYAEVLPNLVAPILVYTTLLIPAAISFEATLSFLGLGVVPPQASWGDMLATGVQYYQQAWWYITFPAIALLITTVSFNLLGDSLRDALDPRGERLLAAMRKKR
jgi:ABC-type dipeptide/oligopeptide/nickel transport system permease subunit